MRIPIKLLLFFGLALLLRSETQVSISSSAGLVTVGDHINLKIIVKTTSGIDHLEIANGQKTFEVVAEGEVKKRRETDYTVLEKNIVVTFFSTGDFEIEPFKVDLIKDGEVVETKTTNSIPITVKSVLNKDDQDIKPLKDPIPLQGNPFFVLKYVLFVLGLVLLAILAVWWYKKKKAAAPVPAPEPLSPIREFEIEIRKLWEQGLFEKGMLKLFFIQLTQITKRFLHRRYRFNAEDLTTYETLYYLGKKERESLVVNNMKYLFEVADLVKFAKYVPQAGIREELGEKIGETIAYYKQKEAALQEENKNAGLRT